MDTQLEMAVNGLLLRSENTGLKGRKSRKTDLDTFEDWFPGLLPDWYRELLESKELGGVFFESKVDGVSWEGEGHFRDAGSLLSEVEGAYPDVDLAQRGYLAICDDGDGSCWVIRADSTPEDPVEFVQMADYGGGNTHESDYIMINQGESFAEFLLSLKPAVTVLH